MSDLLLGFGMVEIYRDRDTVKVGYLKSLLESEGIPCFIKNDNLSIVEVPIPAFYPALNIVNVEDIPKARKILSELQEGDSILNTDPNKAPVTEEDIPCPHCAEENPANFGNCWSCCGEL